MKTSKEYEKVFKHITSQLDQNGKEGLELLLKDVFIKGQQDALIQIRKMINLTR